MSVRDIVNAAAGTGGAAAANYIEDVFSTYLYTGNGSTQTITNGIDLSGKGGLVWSKSRSDASFNKLYDSARGISQAIETNTTDANQNEPTGITSFNSNGYTYGSDGNTNNTGTSYVSWTFREQAKFFDIVTYTGTGSNRTISHNLGSVPGCIIVKRTDTTGDWQVYHRSLANTEYMVLNSTAAKATGTTRWNSTTPTSTEFSLGTDATVNASGGTYVAYLFAHDAGGFGASGSDNVISCGAVTVSSADATANLGWEPQFVLYKASSTDGNWKLIDSMRGVTANVAVDTSRVLQANNSNAEQTNNGPALTPSGFILPYVSGNAHGNATYIYIAIRRGPMKTPTSGTSVFTPTVYTGTNVDNRLVDTTIAPDMVWVRQRDDTVLGGMVVGDRLRGQPYLLTGTDAAEVNDADAFDQQIVSTTEYGTAFSSMNGFWCGNDATAKLNTNTTSNNHIALALRRAPGFFDVVAYTGTGVARTVPHNLGAVPELMIVKGRSSGNEGNWNVYSQTLGNTGILLLNTTLSANDIGTSNIWWNSTTPTATQFTVGTRIDSNGSGFTYIAYLFATVPGVSKVGSYTGTGTTKQIDCGFTGGARFVLIKRTDSTGDWYVWDTARGIVAGNDPYLLLNSTAAEVTNTDYIDTYSAGFEISSTAPAAINANGGTFIFFAVS